MTDSGRANERNPTPPAGARPSLDPDLTSLVVGEEARAQITACLQRVMNDSGASYCMVIDRAGQILAEESDSVRPEMVHLGALLAATYASTQEMARILKQEGFKSLFQEGLTEKIFTETVRDRWLLVVIFDHSAQVGLVKVLARRASATLSHILDIVQQESQEQSGRMTRRMGKATTDTIDLIFNDQSDDDSDE